MNVESFKYDNRIVRAFAIATVVWGIVGMFVGLCAAIELFYPAANLSLQYVTFGRSSATACSWASTIRCSGSARRGCSATP
jgi:cbb3-type cytochrome oxidase subunit 1